MEMIYKDGSFTKALGGSTFLFYSNAVPIKMLKITFNYPYPTGLQGGVLKSVRPIYGGSLKSVQEACRRGEGVKNRRKPACVLCTRSLM